MQMHMKLEIVLHCYIVEPQLLTVLHPVLQIQNSRYMVECQSFTMLR
jgi:hypothetical protein